MKIQTYVITNRVSLTILPTTYTYQIDGKVFEGDWNEEDHLEANDRELMYENVLDEVALEYSGSHSDDDSEEEYEAFEIALRKLHNTLIPNNPIIV